MAAKKHVGSSIAPVAGSGQVKKRIRRRLKPRIINKKFGDKVRVIRFVEPDEDGHLQVLCECECTPGKFNLFVTRASSLTRKAGFDSEGKWRQPTRSCGCDERASYKRNIIDPELKLIPAELRNQWWFAAQAGHKTKDLADKSGYSKKLVDFAVREVHASIGSLKEAASQDDWALICDGVREHCTATNTYPPYVRVAKEHRTRPNQRDAFSLVQEEQQARQISSGWGHLRGCGDQVVQDLLDLAAWVINVTKIAKKHKKQQIVAFQRKAKRVPKPKSKTLGVQP